MPDRSGMGIATRAGAKKKRDNPEERLQMDLADHIRARQVPGLFWFHVPNGGKRGIREATRFKAMGVRAGTPDLIFLHNGQFYAMELKAGTGSLQKNQKEALIEIAAAGGKKAVCKGLDAALDQLIEWGLIR